MLRNSFGQVIDIFTYQGKKKGHFITPHKRPPGRALFENLLVMHLRFILFALLFFFFGSAKSFAYTSQD